MTAPVYELSRLQGRTGVFADREEAGRVLSELLLQFTGPSSLLLAIPAGGVPVAAAAADILGLPLDLAVVSKITLPWDREAGYGAVAFDGSCRINEPLLDRLGLSEREVRAGVLSTRRKVRRRLRRFRGRRPFPELGEKTVILVDDGLASGFTMQVAVEAVRRAGGARIVAAVPTGHGAAVKALAHSADAVCCANLREGLPFAVAAAYRRWTDVAEEEVDRLLALRRTGPGAGPASQDS